MQAPVLLITPPFTQLNTPYPATAYLKGFLNTKGIAAFQCDLGIEATLRIFCKTGLIQLFEEVIKSGKELSENAARMLTLRDDYTSSIDDVIAFLQGKRPTLAHRIAGRGFLPEASRFAQLDDLQWAFGSMGTQDRAKHIATLYLEDLSDLIQETVDEHFGFSRYAERLGRSANSFDDLHEALLQPLSYVDRILVDLLEEKIKAAQPRLVALSVPFPGNLYTSLRCGQWIKKNYPSLPVVMGGGFANTELRSLSDPRVFDYYDYITLDDGEAPIEQLIALIEGRVEKDGLKRTFTREGGTVVFYNNASCTDYRQGQVGTPDYSDFLLDRYISAIEVVNPMHSLWSDGRWNKLTMAHGCYWGKCTFCDISLDYIKNYEPLTAGLLVDRMEELIAQT
ncbi:MAG: radical SAM protein, partial [Chitinophagaceae bacterium]